MNNAGTSSDSSIQLFPMNHNHQQQNQKDKNVQIGSLPAPPPNLPLSDQLEAVKMNNPSASTSQATHLDHDQHQQQTSIEITPQPGSHSLLMEPQQNLPCLDLLQGSRSEYIKVGVPLYEAAIKGDWKVAKLILDQRPDLIRFAITENYDTLLHIAASAESTKAVEEFVMNLVPLMGKKDLELQNKNSDTALMLAAAVGNVKTGMIMVEKNPNLIEIQGRNGTMPLYIAALFAKPDMVRYLYRISKAMKGDNWIHEHRGWVLQKCVQAEIFDVALKILNDCPELILEKWLLTDVLLALAQNAHAINVKKPHIIFRIIKSIFHVKVMSGEKESEALQLLRMIWKEVATMPKCDIDHILLGPPLTENHKIKGFPSQLLFVATEMGNTRFIVELIRLYPDIIWKQDDKGKTIFHLAIELRQAEIYNLLYEIGAMRELITPIKDKEGNNMLHMVANKANNQKNQNMSGAALEMQRELLWYKEVEQMIPPQYRLQKNKDGKTPQDLFAEKHKDLVSKGESWMNNYMLVATLIATIVFAAAFTLPGGYDQHTGIPFFRKEQSFIVFVISDAVSLIFSSTSVLIFLSILTSRYIEHDYMNFLPRRLMFGIATLFLSIVTMMVAFSASFFVLYDKKLKWVPFTITCLAGMPVILFAKMQLKLLADAFYFTYRSRHLFKPKKRILYA